MIIVNDDTETTPVIPPTVSQIPKSDTISDEDDEIPLSRLIAQPSSTLNSTTALAIVCTPDPDSCTSPAFMIKPCSVVLSPLPSSYNIAAHAVTIPPDPSPEQPHEPSEPTQLNTSAAVLDQPLSSETKTTIAPAASTPSSHEPAVHPNQPCITKFTALLKHASPESIEATITSVLSGSDDSPCKFAQPSHPSSEEMHILSALECELGLVEVHEEPMPLSSVVPSSESSASATTASSIHVVTDMASVALVAESPTPPPAAPSPPRPLNRLQMLPFPLRRDMRLAPANRRPDLFAADNTLSSKASATGGASAAGEKTGPAGKGLAAWRALGFQIGKKSSAPGDPNAAVSKSTGVNAARSNATEDASALPEPLVRMRASLDLHLTNQVISHCSYSKSPSSEV